jgi:hypothetical protein
MSTPWIKIEHTTPDKPEVIRMAAILKLDQDAVVGKLLRVWIWADANTVPGERVPATEMFLDRHTQCKKFAAAMREVGWLAGTDGALQFPAFEAHNGNSAKARAVTARRVEKHRSGNDAAAPIVTPPPLQKPLPEKEIEKDTSLPPAGGQASARGWSREDLEVIAKAYGKQGNPMTVLPLIHASLASGHGTVAEIEAGTLRASEVIRANAPQGFNSARVPHAETFFEREQWRNPESFAGYWDKPKGKGSADSFDIPPSWDK